MEKVKEKIEKKKTNGVLEKLTRDELIAQLEEKLQRIRDEFNHESGYLKRVKEEVA